MKQLIRSVVGAGFMLIFIIGGIWMFLYWKGLLPKEIAKPVFDLYLSPIIGIFVGSVAAFFLVSFLRRGRKKSKNDIFRSSDDPNIP